MKLLHIDSSSLGGASVSRALTASIVEARRQADPTIDIVRRDLAAAPPDHLTTELVEVVKLGKTEGLTERQRQELDLTNALIEEFLAADVIVIGAPMYNFTVPTQLKAWIDRIAQAGRTFRYTENGPVGLAGGKKVVIASSRGGRYTGTAFENALDHQEAYLRAVFGLLGITDVSVIRAEGLNMGPEVRAQSVAAAHAEIAGLSFQAAA